MPKVLVTGGTGLVGTALIKRLREKGYEAAVLSRTGNITGKIPSYKWDTTANTIDNAALADTDFIIHLSGANIGEKRWSEERKKLILDSRIKGGTLLFERIKAANHSLKAFISSSAIGYYGSVTSEHIFRETDGPGRDFQGDVCKQWEHTADEFRTLGTRVVKIRSGVVLSEQGGALPKMMLPVKLGFGSALGDGRQYLPWIHIDDLCDIYLKAIEDGNMTGAYNAAAPEHKSNKEFIRDLAEVLNRPLWLPHVPGFILKLIFGKRSELFLKGSRISTERITASGYTFKFFHLKSALNDLLKTEKKYGG